MALEHVDPRKNPITTILGIMLLTMGMCSGMAIWVVPVFWEVKSDILGNWYIYFMPGIPITFGLWALFIPDKWVKISSDAVEKIRDKVD